MRLPFNKQIKQARESLELTAKECAERVSAAFPEKPMDRTAWSQLERYESKRANPDTIKRVAVGLGLAEQTVASWDNYVVTEGNEVDDFLIAFGRRIASLREGRMTQEELGQAIGMTRKWVDDVEEGYKEISAYLVEKLADALGVSIEVLYGHTRKRQEVLLSEEEDLNARLQACVQALEKKHPDERKWIEMVAQIFDNLGYVVSLSPVKRKKPS